MRYVRTYPTELAALGGLLPEIRTPVQIICGRQDPVVPPVNAEFLHERLPHSKLDILETGHFTWEDNADEYAALVTSWWGRRLRDHRWQPCLGELWAPKIATAPAPEPGCPAGIPGEFLPGESGSAGVGIRRDKS
jgi:hypothetical protein